MNTKLARALCAAAVLSLLSSAALADSLQSWQRKITELSAQALPSVVRVIVPPAAAEDDVGELLSDGRGKIGSGLVIGDGSRVLTTSGVVGDAGKVIIVDAQGTRHEAEVKGRDEILDIAVVDLTNGKLTAVSPAVAEELEFGSLVFVFGYGSGSDQPTVSMGLAAGGGNGVENEDSLLQITAPLYPGNAGGPVIDVDGRLVGLVAGEMSPGPRRTQLSRDVDVETLDRRIILRAEKPAANGGWSLPAAVIPAARVLPMIDELVRKGTIARGWLGVALDAAENLSGSQGAEIIGVTPDSPADKAGLRVGDVITAISGTAVSRPTEAVNIVQRSREGDQLILTLNRDGKEMTVPVTLERKAPDKPRELRRIIARTSRQDLAEQWIGIELSPPAAESGQETPAGPLISHVIPGSAGEKAGLKTGDVIAAVNGATVSDINDLNNKLAAADENEPLTLDLLRQNEPLKITLSLDSRPEQEENVIIIRRGEENETFEWTGELDSIIDLDEIIELKDLGRRLKQDLSGITIPDIGQSAPAHLHRELEAERAKLQAEIDALRDELNHLQLQINEAQPDAPAAPAAEPPAEPAGEPPAAPPNPEAEQF